MNDRHLMDFESCQKLDSQVSYVPLYLAGNSELEVLAFCDLLALGDQGMLKYWFQYANLIGIQLAIVLVLRLQKSFKDMNTNDPLVEC